MLVLVSFQDDCHNAVGLGIRCICTWGTKKGHFGRIERVLKCWAPTEAPRVETGHIFVFYDAEVRPGAGERNDSNTSDDDIKFEFHTVSAENKILGANCKVIGCGVQVITDLTGDKLVSGITRESETRSIIEEDTSPLQLSMASSSSLSRNWLYDVFPSFSGGDVRSAFLSHVLKEFKSKGITPFVDDNFDRSVAIIQSRVAVVLLSTNYASSSWCLDELVEIMKCREEDKQTVMTIFYGVDPSDVRKQTGVFGDAFDKTCVGKTEEVMQAWRQALKDVANIAGYHSPNWNNEADLINKIASDVTGVLDFTPSKDFDDFVGMGARITEIKSLLSLQSDNVKVFGIVGLAGIGKTSIPRALPDPPDFALSTFLENIRGKYSIPTLGGSHHQFQLDCHKQLPSQLFKQTDFEIPHMGIVKDRRKDKKVLVDLDEVDCLLQVEAMANKPDCGPGSMIITTTKDRKPLIPEDIKHIFKLSHWKSSWRKAPNEEGNPNK